MAVGAAAELRTLLSALPLAALLWAWLWALLLRSLLVVTAAESTAAESTAAVGVAEGTAAEGTCQLRTLLSALPLAALLWAWLWALLLRSLLVVTAAESTAAESTAAVGVAEGTAAEGTCQGLGGSPRDGVCTALPAACGHSSCGDNKPYGSSSHSSGQDVVNIPQQQQQLLQARVCRRAAQTWPAARLLSPLAVRQFLEWVQAESAAPGSTPPWRGCNQVNLPDVAAGAAAAAADIKALERERDQAHQHAANLRKELHQACHYAAELRQELHEARHHAAKMPRCILAACSSSSSSDACSSRLADAAAKLAASVVLPQSNAAFLVAGDEPQLQPLQWGTSSSSSSSSISRWNSSSADNLPTVIYQQQQQQHDLDNSQALLQFSSQEQRGTLLASK
ncbi:hypothetical protein COO60DRAFT_1636242 [Scenedesmus sp. NREL 46B-D3]|nr:hypothetical protein COO60DRAFT_1636242 [Scenedesmus sp. NREL 46B-D3]